jgi:ADP-ribose pyrophosphatase YjhB (NUDIX family)
VGSAVGALERGAIHRAHVTLLAVFARLPVVLRRAVVRRVGVAYTMGALVLLEDGDRVLLIRPSYRPAWSLPGGLLRRGEEPATAAVREVGEEVGVTVVGLSGGAVVMDVPARRIDVVYRGRVAEGDKPRSTSPEVREQRWFERSRLPELLPEAETAMAALERRTEGPYVLPAGGRSPWLS